MDADDRDGGDGGPTADGAPSDRAVRGRGSACGRRPLLAAVGAAASGLAGCSRITSYTYEADPVVLPAEVQSSLGLSESVRQSVTRQYDRTVEGMRLDVTVTNRVAVYEAVGDGWPGDAAGVGVLATPAARLMGRSLNPLVGMALQDLLTDPRAEAVLGQSGLAEDDAVEWLRGPSALATEPAEPAPVLLGTETALRSFGAVVGAGEPAAAFVHAARAAPASDVVLAAAVHRHAVPDTAGPYVGPDGFVPAATVERARERARAALAALEVEG